MKCIVYIYIYILTGLSTCGGWTITDFYGVIVEQRGRGSSRTRWKENIDNDTETNGLTPVEWMDAAV